MAKLYWYEERPGIFEKEKQQLLEAGITFNIDETVLPYGIIRLQFAIEPGNLNFNLSGQKEALKLIAVYPDSYPYFRPQVFAPDLDLARHQNPIGKNLCLLGRSTIWWNSSSSLVDLLKEQLPKLLVKGIIIDPEILKNDETEQAEPVSEYYSAAGNSVLFDKSIFSEIELKDQTPRLLGTIILGSDNKESTFLPRLAVLETSKVITGAIGVAPNIIQRTFTNLFSGQLYRISERPPENPTETLNWLKELLAENGEIFKPVKIDVHLINGHYIKSVIGLCFEEEQEKGKNGYAWLFHIELQQKGAPVKKGVRHNPAISIPYYARLVNIDMQINLRAPKLAPLAKKRIGLVGLGALGSFIAIELARSGIGVLNLMDHDTVEPANTIRWPLGMIIAGQHKTSTIEEFINDNYPGTKVKSQIWQLGTFRVNMEGLPNEDLHMTEKERLETFFEGLSMVIDATTEFGVHHLLSQEAKKRGIPYINVYATAGAYGGSIMREIPGKTGCWSCFMHMENDGSIPLLNEDKTSAGLIQPPGCGDITFTGASVDLQQISMMATKFAISTLCEGIAEGYPPVDCHIARVNLFGENGEFIVPEWNTYDLPIHPSCHYCN